jgi:putative restriction endonuclease
LSVTPDLLVEVSRKIKEEFDNGRDYYALHGRKLAVVPATERERPSPQYLEWHNSNVYLG